MNNQTETGQRPDTREERQAAARRRSKRAWKTIGIAVLLMAVVVYWRGPIGCYAFYPECNPLIPVPPMPGWDVPTNAVEKQWYDFAHAIELPDQVPKPVPFDFKAARMRAIERKIAGPGMQQAMAEEYFEHLCRTEAALTVIEKVEGVRGLAMLRAERRAPTELESERYREELPFRSAVELSLRRHGGGLRGLPEHMIPSTGTGYEFLEFPNAEPEGQWLRYQWGRNPNPPYGFDHGISARLVKNGPTLRIPLMIVERQVAEPTARYALTWRGIRRERDREFAIAGQELIALELPTKRVLAVLRDFKPTGRSRRYHTGIWWGTGRDCFQVLGHFWSMHPRKTVSEHVFVPDHDFQIQAQAEVAAILKEKDHAQ